MKIASHSGFTYLVAVNTLRAGILILILERRLADNSCYQLNSEYNHWQSE